MRFLFHNDAAFNKMKVYVLDTWKCLGRGEGEEEIANHGRSRVKSFSQETEAIGQHSHGVTKLSRSYTLKSQLQDAYDSPIQLPFFFSSRKLILIMGLLAGSLSYAQVDAPTPGENTVNKFNGMTMPSRFMRKPVQKSSEQKLKDVSEMYEKHFLREMLKGMRSTVHEGGFIQQNQAEKIFREQLDDHYVEKWSDKGGIGLSKLIYDQLVDKFGAQLGIKKNVEKPKGPLPLDERSMYTAHQFKHPGKKDAMSYRIDKNIPKAINGVKMPVAAGDRGDVKSPWMGTITGVRKLPDEQNMFEIEHDNGLKSQVVFKGAVSKLSTGDHVQAGETLGVLSDQAKSLYWTVEPESTSGPQSVSE